jgi:hypothetical protein
MAASHSRPSERSCLIAWNAPSNQANRAKLIARRPIAGLFLGTAVSGTVTWTKEASPSQSTPHQACMLTIAKSQQIQMVTGVWKAGRVSEWSFGRSLPTATHPPGNVRLLSGGRVTKIYRR